VPANGNRRDARAATALEAVTDHAGAADAAFFDRTAARAVERGKHVFVAHVETVDVVQIAVERFAGNRQCPLAHRPHPRDEPLDRRIAYCAAGMRIRDRDRTIAAPTLFHPMAPGEFTVAVQTEISRPHTRGGARSTTRQDCSDAGADRAVTHYPLTRTADQRRVSDFDASDVGNRIERAGHAVKRNAERTRTRAS
jgi:hypothetical protein